MAGEPSLDVGVLPAHSQEVPPFVIATAAGTQDDQDNVDRGADESRGSGIKGAGGGDTIR